MSKATALLNQYPWIPAVGLAVAFLVKEFLKTEDLSESISRTGLKVQWCDCLMQVQDATESQLDAVLGIIDRSGRALPEGSLEAKRRRAESRLIGLLKRLYEPTLDRTAINNLASMLLKLQ